MHDYHISTNNSLLNKEKIWSLLKVYFWTKNIPIDYVENFIKHSLCFGVYQNCDNQLVGFGRVITDYTTYAYVCDVVINPTHRKKGLGNALIKAIICYPKLQGMKTWALKTTEEARKIYEKYGFSIAEHPETQLEINDLEIYSRSTFINLHKRDKNRDV